jgi:hypothetical protein
VEWDFAVLLFIDNGTTREVIFTGCPGDNTVPTAGTAELTGSVVPH